MPPACPTCPTWQKGAHALTLTWVCRKPTRERTESIGAVSGISFSLILSPRVSHIAPRSFERTRRALEGGGVAHTWKVPGFVGRGEAPMEIPRERFLLAQCAAHGNVPTSDACISSLVSFGGGSTSASISLRVPEPLLCRVWLGSGVSREGPQKRLRGGGWGGGAGRGQRSHIVPALFARRTL